MRILIALLLRGSDDLQISIAQKKLAFQAVPFREPQLSLLAHRQNLALTLMSKELYYFRMMGQPG